MAGDWIKAEHTLPDKPEVVAMAACLNIDQDAVVGKLLRLWIWADQQFSRETILKRNCNGLTVSLSFIDRVTFCDGFGKAMISVGWLDGRDGSYSLPNFERHNGTTAKERASTYRRVKQSREVKRKCNGAGVTKPLPETETEIDVIHTHTPADEGSGKPAMAESYPAQDAGIICVEIDGELISYDQDSLRWEAEFIRQWNAASNNAKHSMNALAEPHRNLLRARLSDPGWFWKRALAKFPLWSETGWKPGLTWFLEPNSVQNILEGRHDQRTPSNPKGKKHDRQVSNPGQVYDPIAAKNDPLGINEW